jgi:hypothetical protein
MDVVIGVRTVVLRVSTMLSEVRLSSLLSSSRQITTRKKLSDSHDGNLIYKGGYMCVTEMSIVGEISALHFKPLYDTLVTNTVIVLHNDVT